MALDLGWDVSEVVISEGGERLGFESAGMMDGGSGMVG